jgi:hypothetical protein
MLKCENCTKLLIGEQKKYCSRKCSATVNNKKFPKRRHSGNICEICNTKLNVSQSFTCSRECRTIREQRQTEKKILANEVESPEVLKKYIARIRGYFCSICENDGWYHGKKLVLQLDHIDGNSDNNDIANLRLLCPNCHSQTETFSTRQKKMSKRNRYLRKIKGYNQ